MVDHILATHIMVRRFADGKMLAENRPYKEDHIYGNVGLEVGIQVMEDAFIGAGISTFNSGVAHCAVGTFSGAASAGQTGVQSALAYGRMDPAYPARTNQTLSWRSTFSGNVANGLWNEFSVANQSGVPVALFRKVSPQGTKLSGQAWELTAEVSIA